MIDFSAKKWFWIVLDRSGSGNCSTLPQNLSQLWSERKSAWLPDSPHFWVAVLLPCPAQPKLQPHTFELETPKTLGP